jgi:hypothetical protein
MSKHVCSHCGKETEEIRPTRVDSIVYLLCMVCLLQALKG